MRIKNLIDEDFVQFKEPSMFIGTCFCTFKCGEGLCQNRALAIAKIIDMPDDEIIRRYLANPITSSIVFGGLEPFEQLPELIDFLKKLREEYHCNDTVVIYSGWTEAELAGVRWEFRDDPNLIVKVGRFVPNSNSRYDELLGVTLVSDNQYAVDWSSHEDNP